MRRPLVWVTVSALVAVYGAVAGFRWCLPVFLAALVCITLYEYKRNHSGFVINKAFKYCIYNILVSVIVYLIAFLYATHCMSFHNPNSPINELNNLNDKVVLAGQISQVSVKDYGVVLMMIDCSMQETDATGLKLLVTVYDDVLSDTASSLESGDELQVTGTIAEIEGPSNDGEFDAKGYYGSLGIFYRVTVDNIVHVEKVKGMRAYINKLKARFDMVYSYVSDDTEAGILKAIVLGDKDSLDDNVYELYKDNGIAHILAISGLHILFIGMMIYKLFKRFLSGYIVPFSASMTVLVLYSVMTGNSVSAKRAVIMCVISMGADVLGRTYDVLSALSLAALLLVFENVFIIYNSGFQLSFGAIIGIAVVYPAFDKLFVEPLDKWADRLDRKRQVVKRRMLKSVVVFMGNIFSSVSVSLVTLPIIMYQYYQVPVYSIFLNIVVIPLMSLLLLCALMVAVVGCFSLPLATFLMGTVHYILKLYTMLCNAFESVPGNIWVAGKPEFQDCVMFYILLGLFVALVSFSKVNSAHEKCDKRSKIVSFIQVYTAIVGIAIIVLIPRKEEGLAIRMIDVGQGDCIYVQYQNETYLFDGGSTDLTAVGERRIFPCLRYHGVTDVDYVFISHADTDHISGILELLDMQDSTFVVKNMVLPDIKGKESQEKYMELVDKAESVGVNVLYVAEDDCYSSGDGRLSLRCLHPKEGYDYGSANDYSAVYRLSYDNFSMLLTGDVEKAGEEAILENISSETSAREDVSYVNIKSNVLKVAHHGSKNSSGHEFIDAVTPKIALISCGEDNLYGHPHKDTLERLNSVGAKVYVTAECGQITIEVGEKVRVYGYRK